ncbi:Hydroxyacylglutathione hydrolase GloC [Fundidesulfovibrio magnetotacticus]|uniref:Hydroxyacylglutathione hydrolase GloC n=1 Tax=Fundidesulfovibrio magnetotacticus TaxID=2730080 RepID=A0A6V8M0D0_9BACT|nr:MBL fold metallo-hydrolase [Fundidesulfovibrio magnetotacticus]GFK95918.1 Hydroxyacylglutathione hydrolase GloC [Fundidesulfovibrio magnetotacticus]
MQVEMYSLGPLETNSYLAVEGASAVAVDVGGDPAPMLRHLERCGATLTHILLTHLHFDHAYGVKALAEATGATVHAGAADRVLLDSELGQGGFMGLPRLNPYAFQDLAEGETELLGQPCRVLATPGHSPGSLTYHFPKAGVAFTGDVLFYRSIGRTDFPGGSLDTLLEAVRSKLFTLPGETVLYPGHGPETTVTQEKLHNPYFSDFAR